MQIEQLNGLGRQGLKIQEEPQDEITVDFREQMLLHNDIEGILKFDVRRENNCRVYEYNTAGMEPLQMVCARRRLCLDEITEILGGVLKSVYHSREFMLVEDDYVIRPDTIFVEPGMKVHVAYFPGYRVSLRKQLCELSEYLMDRIEYKDEGAVLLVYSFYSQTKSDTCSLEDLFNVLSESSTAAEPPAAEKPMGLPVYGELAPTNTSMSADTGRGQPAVVRDQTAFREITPDTSFTPPRAMEVIRQSPKRLRCRAALIPLALIAVVLALLKSGLLNNPATDKPYVLATFGCSFVALCLTVEIERRMWNRFYLQLVDSLKSAAAARDEATVMVYSDGTVSYPFSLVSDEYEAINASRFPFVIGRSAESSDYCLDKTGVSRQHMRIDKTDTGFAVTDLGSVNGTYVNSIRLRPGVPTPVRCGDTIKIGTILYYCNR